MKIIRSDDKTFVPASHENPLAPGVWKKVLFQRGEFQPGTVQMVNWARLPAGSSFAAHYHEDMQEIFIIVAGEATMVVSAQKIVLGRGDTIAIDPREVHRMNNCGGEDVEYVVFGITGGTGRENGSGSGQSPLIPCSPATDCGSAYQSSTAIASSIHQRSRTVSNDVLNHVANGLQLLKTILGD